MSGLSVMGKLRGKPKRSQVGANVDRGERDDTDVPELHRWAGNGLSIVIMIHFAFQLVLMIFALMDYGGAPPAEFNRPKTWLWADVSIAGVGVLAMLICGYMKQAWDKVESALIPAGYWKTVRIHIALSIVLSVMRIALISTFVSRFEDYLPAFNSRYDTNILISGSESERSVLNYLSSQWMGVTMMHFYGVGVLFFSLLSMLIHDYSKTSRK